MTKPSEASTPLAVLRIYLPRRTTRPGRGLLGRLFGRPLSFHLADRALRSDVRYATVTLPTCLELVGSRAVLDVLAILLDVRLVDAVLLRLEGVEVSLRGVQE